MFLASPTKENFGELEQKPAESATTLLAKTTALIIVAFKNDQFTCKKI